MPITKRAEPRPAHTIPPGWLRYAREEAQIRHERRGQLHVDRAREEELKQREALLVGLSEGAPALTAAAIAVELRDIQEELCTILVRRSTWDIGWDRTVGGTPAARPGESIDETSWRILVERRGATGYQIAMLVGGDRDSSERKRVDRWRAAYRKELEAAIVELETATTMRVPATDLTVPIDDGGRRIMIDAISEMLARLNS